MYLWELITLGCSVSTALALLKWYLLYLQENILEVLLTLSPESAQSAYGAAQILLSLPATRRSYCRISTSQSLDAMQPPIPQDTEGNPSWTYLLMRLQSCMTAVTGGNHAGFVNSLWSRRDTPLSPLLKAVTPPGLQGHRDLWTCRTGAGKERPGVELLCTQVLGLFFSKKHREFSFVWGHLLKPAVMLLTRSTCSRACGFDFFEEFK